MSRLWQKLKSLPTNRPASIDSDGGCAKPFVEHLEDLRRTIVWSALACVVGIATVAPFAPRIVALLRRPMVVTGLDQLVPLRITTVGGAFAVAMRVILLSGFLVSLPVILIVVGLFVFPGLTRREKTALLRASAFAAVLFGTGVAMGYRWTLPIALRMMFNIGAWIDTPPVFWETADYMSFVLKLLIAFGLTFELPVVVLALGRMGILSARQLMDKRRHVIVGLLILAMFLTPQDPFTMLLMAAPLIALYEMCIWLTWFKERRSTER